MSTSISVRAYSGKDSNEFKKHYKAVQFCIENELSYPIETSNFFKGKVDGGNIEDYGKKYILELIQNGVEIKLNITKDEYGNKCVIKKSDIPDCVDEIVITLS